MTLNKMKHMLNDALWYVWQLPQNIVGLIVFVKCMLFNGIETRTTFMHENVYHVFNLKHDCAFGKYVLVSSNHVNLYSRITKLLERNELSRMYGWAYLPIELINIAFEK